MSSVTVVRRWLKVVDPTALTARETLQRALGYGRGIVDVARSDILVLEWDARVSDPKGEVERLARRTNLIHNPNKHHFEVVLDGETVQPRGNGWVLVWEEGEGEVLGRAMQRHGGLSDTLKRVRSAVLWELELEGDAARRLAQIEEMAVARERHRGLLSNPHVQESAVFTDPPTADRLAVALTALTAGETA